MVAADQLTKLWAVSSLSGKPSSELLGDFVMLTLVYNEGGAMGTNFGTPLHIAASAGHTEIAEMLIAKGADVNIKNKRNQTPLTVAKQKNDKAMIELLEKHGAQ